MTPKEIETIYDLEAQAQSQNPEENLALNRFMNLLTVHFQLDDDLEKLINAFKKQPEVNINVNHHHIHVQLINEQQLGFKIQESLQPGQHTPNNINAFFQYIDKINHDDNQTVINLNHWGFKNLN